MSAPLHADPVDTLPAATPRPVTRTHLSVMPPVSAMPGTAASQVATLSPLRSIPVERWHSLAARAAEPNVCYAPEWALAVAAHAPGKGHALAISSFDRDDPARLTGLMPMRWARHALALPVPLLVSWNAYAPYSVPLLDGEQAEDAAGAIIDAAIASGARALLLQAIATGGPAFRSLNAALARRGLRPETISSYRRAALDARQQPDAVLRDAISAKKLKELRRQRHRLEDSGAVHFACASDPAAVQTALERFLKLEARGWKGQRGTALIQQPGDAAFIREAAMALASKGQFQVVTLDRNDETLAAGLILRGGGRASFFKIAMDEDASRTSPGVQLTLDLTRHLCADPAVIFADSTTDGAHPMIDHLWRERIEIADIFIALSPRDLRATAIRAIVTARYRAVAWAKKLRSIRETLT